MVHVSCSSHGATCRAFYSSQGATHSSFFSSHGATRRAFYFSQGSLFAEKEKVEDKDMLKVFFAALLIALAFFVALLKALPFFAALLIALPLVASAPHSASARRQRPSRRFNTSPRSS